MPFNNLKHSNTSNQEWKAVRALAHHRTIVIKRADKGSCAVAWDRIDYLLEAEKKLGDSNVYKSDDFKEKLLTDQVESCNNMFLNLKQKGLGLKAFYNFKNKRKSVWSNVFWYVKVCIF